MRKSPEFAGMMQRQEYDEALYYISEQMMTTGAAVLAIDLDALPDSPAAMEHFVRLIQSDPSVSMAALMIESADFDTLLQGLKNAQGKCIAGPLDPGSSDFIEKASVLRSLGAALLVKAGDNERALSLLTEAGVPAEDIVFVKE